MSTQSVISYEQGHVHYKNDCTFGKIFHMSPQVTAQKIDKGGQRGLIDFCSHLDP